MRHDEALYKSTDTYFILYYGYFTYLLYSTARSQSLSPLVDGRVNNVLLQTVPDFNEALLQLIDAVHTTFIHSLLYNTPDLITL